MNILNSIFATIRFELSRVMTMHRMSVAVVMTLFPPAMIFILDSTDALVAPEFLISLFCGMVCLLSLLLWSTSNVFAELEGKSWTFVTTRPFGRWSILFGKYLIGFGLSFMISWIALSLCMLVAADAQFLTEMSPDNFGDSFLEIVESTETENAENAENAENGGEVVGANESEQDDEGFASSADVIANEQSQEGNSRFMIWTYLSVMLFLASMVYSAIFSFLGVVIQRRAMVFAVGYFAIVEVVCAPIPAVIGKFAMSFHMFSLLFQWNGWLWPEDSVGENEFLRIYSIQEPWVHLAAIFGMTIFMLGISAFIIRVREYITLEDSQV